MGFSVPPRLRLERWAFTPPFHPYRRALRTGGGLFSVALSVERDLRPFLPRVSNPAIAEKVTRHRALWSSDFPPPAEAEGDPPPFQSRLQLTGESAQCKEKRAHLGVCFRFGCV